MRKSPAEAEEGAQETEFERFLQESGLNEAQAMGLLRAAYGRQMQLMERAQQVLAAVRAIGDENFTIEALQSNPEAMRALEEGGTVGEIYRRYFLRRGESGEGGGDGFGTLLAVGAVVGVAGVVAYQVGTELILDQLLPAGVAVPHTRAELAMFLWNTAGRPAPATLPAFADVADPELAQAAQWAIEQGYLKARADGSFKPDKGVAKWRVIRGYRAVTEP